MGTAYLPVGILILYHPLQIVERTYTLSLRITQQALEYTGQGFCIVVSPVRDFFIVGNAVVPGDVAQTVRPSFRKKRSGQIQCIDDRILQFRISRPPELFIQEVVVK